MGAVVLVLKALAYSWFAVCENAHISSESNPNTRLSPALRGSYN